MNIYNNQVESVTVKMGDIHVEKPGLEDNTVEYRTTSHYQSQSMNPKGKTFLRVTSFEASRTLTSNGEADYVKKHITITSPDYVSGEILYNKENDRTQTLKKLKSTFFLSKANQDEEKKTDPFARFGTRSMVDGNALQEKSYIEIHKFPFAEPFSSPNSIRKEQISYSTSTRGKSKQKITSITKTEIQGENKTCSLIETREIITKDDETETNEGD